MPSVSVLNETQSLHLTHKALHSLPPGLSLSPAAPTLCFVNCGPNILASLLFRYLCLRHEIAKAWFSALSSSLPLFKCALIVRRGHSSQTPPVHGELQGTGLQSSLADWLRAQASEVDRVPVLQFIFPDSSQPTASCQPYTWSCLTLTRMKTSCPLGHFLQFAAQFSDMFYHSARMATVPLNSDDEKRHLPGWQERQQ